MSQLRHNSRNFEPRRENRKEYYRAIRRSTQNNDCGIFILFMLSVIKQATEDFKDKYNRDEIINDGVKNKIADSIISIIKNNPYHTVKDIAKILGKSKSTIERHLKILKEQNAISREGSDKTGKWIRV